MTENSNVEPQTSNLLPLDVNERVIVFYADGALRRHVLRPCSTERAREFFRALQYERDTERDGGDADKPMFDLWRSLLVRVEGYGDLSAIPNWLERIRPAHVLGATRELMMAAPAQGNDATELDPEFDTTVLEAMWNPLSAEADAMASYPRLVHRFEPVTQADRHEYKRDKNKGKVVGGSRSGVTLYPAPENLLLRFYDRKIRAVEGYSVAGAPMQSIGDIAARMDPFHKLSAIWPLFSDFILDGRRGGQPSAEQVRATQQELAKIEAGEAS